MSSVTYSSGLKSAVLPVPQSTKFDMPVELRKGAEFSDVNVTVRVFKGLKVDGQLRVLGNLRVTGAADIKGIARLGSKEESLNPPVPIESEPKGRSFVLYDRFIGLADAYNFEEGLKCTGHSDMLVKGDMYVEGNLDAGRVVLSGKVFFNGGVTYAVQPRYESKKSSMGKRRSEIDGVEMTW